MRDPKPTIITHPLSLLLIKGTSWLFWNQRAQTCSLLWCLKCFLGKCVTFGRIMMSEGATPCICGAPTPPTVSFNYTCTDEKLGEELKEPDVEQLFVLWWHLKIVTGTAFMSAFRFEKHIWWKEIHQKFIFAIKCQLPHLQLFQVGSLHADHRGQQLVLQTVSGHCEIYQGTLGLQLRLVMRTGELGVQDQAETGVVLTLLVSDLYASVSKSGIKTRRVSNVNGKPSQMPASS